MSSLKIKMTDNTVVELPRTKLKENISRVWLFPDDQPELLALWKGQLTLPLINPFETEEYHKVFGSEGVMKFSVQAAADWVSWLMRRYRMEGVDVVWHIPVEYTPQLGRTSAHNNIKFKIHDQWFNGDKLFYDPILTEASVYVLVKPDSLYVRKDLGLTPHLLKAGNHSVPDKMRITESKGSGVSLALADLCHWAEFSRNEDNSYKSGPEGWLEEYKARLGFAIDVVVGKPKITSNKDGWVTEVYSKYDSAFISEVSPTLTTISYNFCLTPQYFRNTDNVETTFTLECK